MKKHEIQMRRCLSSLVVGRMKINVERIMSSAFELAKTFFLMECVKDVDARGRETHTHK